MIRINYNPQVNSFPDKMMKLLLVNGMMKNEEIRKQIGMRRDQKMYFNMSLIQRLFDKRVIKRIKHAYYDLSPEWRQYLCEKYSNM